MPVLAWATLIAQAISACLVLIRLMTSTESYKLILKDIRFHKKVLLETVRIGLPGGIQNAVISFSNLIVQYNINSFGAAAVAGCSAYTKIDGFAILPVMSFSMAITTFTGQNIGAKNYDRVRKGAKTCLVIALAVTLTLSGGLYLFGAKLLRVFFFRPAGFVLCGADDALFSAGLCLPGGCAHLLRRGARSGYLDGADAGAGGKYVRAEGHLDFFGNAGFPQYHCCIFRLFADLADQRLDDGDLLSSFRLAGAAPVTARCINIF